MPNDKLEQSAPVWQPVFAEDEIAINGWKLQMVLFDEDGIPVGLRKPELAEIQAAIARYTA